MTELLVYGYKVIVDGEQVTCDNEELKEEILGSFTDIPTFTAERVMVNLILNSFDGKVTGGDGVYTGQHRDEPKDLIY